MRLAERAETSLSGLDCSDETGVEGDDVAEEEHGDEGVFDVVEAVVVAWRDSLGEALPEDDWGAGGCCCTGTTCGCCGNTMLGAEAT